MCNISGVCGLDFIRFVFNEYCFPFEVFPFGGSVFPLVPVYCQSVWPTATVTQRFPPDCTAAALQRPDAQQRVLSSKHDRAACLTYHTPPLFKKMHSHILHNNLASCRHTLILVCWLPCIYFFVLMFIFSGGSFILSIDDTSCLTKQDGLMQKGIDCTQLHMSHRIKNKQTQEY